MVLYVWILFVMECVDALSYPVGTIRFAMLLPLFGRVFGWW